jgi:anti-anti-sigma factor
MPRMASLTHEVVEGVRMVRLSGSLTQAGIDAIEPAFTSALPDGSRAVVDLSGVDLITTPGLTLIIATDKRLRGTQGRMIFASASAGIRNLLRRCRLDEVLELADDQQEAMKKAKN